MPVGQLRREIVAMLGENAALSAARANRVASLDVLLRQVGMSTAVTAYLRATFGVDHLDQIHDDADLARALQFILRLDGAAKDERD